jgi:hypothetical protein
MRRAILVALGTGAVITSAAAIGIGAMDKAPARALSRAEYRAALARVERANAASVAQCSERSAAQRDICLARAEADQMVRVADIEQSFRRDPAASREAQRARIDARYQVARARCNAVKGYERDKCQIAAHAVRGRALLQSQAPYLETRG